MQVKSISLQLTMYFTISPFHTVIPVILWQFTGKTLLVNTKLHYWLHLFASEAPFTHQFQIVNHFGHIITQKWPLNSCASECCICKHRMYTRSVFLFLCQMSTFMKRFWARHIIPGDFKPNYTAQRKCVIYFRTAMLGPERLNFDFQWLWISPGYTCYVSAFWTHTCSYW